MSDLPKLIYEYNANPNSGPFWGCLNPTELLSINRDIRINV